MLNVEVKNGMVIAKDSSSATGVAMAEHGCMIIWCDVYMYRQAQGCVPNDCVIYADRARDAYLDSAHDRRGSME